MLKGHTNPVLCCVAMSGFYFLACLCSLGGVQTRRGTATSFEQKTFFEASQIYFYTKTQEETSQRKRKVCGLLRVKGDWKLRIKFNISHTINVTKWHENLNLPE